VAAGAEYREAVLLLQKLADDNPTVTYFRSYLWLGHNNLGNVLWQVRKPREAEAEYHEALAIVRKLAEDEPGNPYWRRGGAASLANLGLLDLAAGRFDAAVTKLRESSAIHDRLVHDYPTRSEYTDGLASILRSLGRAYYGAGRAADAVEPLRRAIALEEAATVFIRAARVNLAVDHALLASLAADTRSGLPAGTGEAEADRAMAALRAIPAAELDVSWLKTESDFAHLRGRADFRLLMMDLAMPAEPFAR
jgi:eukaryotic-like serine/threonine-protein kinase